MTKVCDSDLFWAGAAFLYYGGLFTLRNIIIFLSTYWTKKPKIYNLVGRVIGWFIDWVALTILVIWATSVIRSENAMQCKTNDQIIAQWYIVTLVCIVVTYIYLGLLWFFFPGLIVGFFILVCWLRK